MPQQYSRHMSMAKTRLTHVQHKHSVVLAYMCDWLELGHHALEYQRIIQIPHYLPGNALPIMKSVLYIFGSEAIHQLFRGENNTWYKTKPRRHGRGS